MSDSWDKAFYTLFGKNTLDKLSALELNNALPSSNRSTHTDGQKDDNRPEKPNDNCSITPIEVFGQGEQQTQLERLMDVWLLNTKRLHHGLSNHNKPMWIVINGREGTGKTTLASWLAQSWSAKIAEQVFTTRIITFQQLRYCSMDELVAKAQACAKGILLIEDVDQIHTISDNNKKTEVQEKLRYLIFHLANQLNATHVIFTSAALAIDSFKQDYDIQHAAIHLIELTDFTANELLGFIQSLLSNSGYSIDNESLEAIRQELQSKTRNKHHRNLYESLSIFERMMFQQSIRLNQNNLNELNQSTLSHFIYSDVTQDPKDCGTYAQVNRHSDKTASADPFSQLNKLIGLENVKKEIHQLSTFMNVSLARSVSSNHKPTVHMVFTGNPGTGKTTVARLLGEIFQHMGLLSQGHLVEVERADLVGEYLGQTAGKTRKKIQQAIGGILFIDEAYTLHRGEDKDSYGQESIDTILKNMEDHRGDFVVILAGYPKEMATFLDSNPGLQSRFPFHIHFPDYNDTALGDIATLLSETDHYQLMPKAKDMIVELVKKNRGQSNFGNARDVRNLLQKAYRQQAMRISQLGNPKTLSQETLNTIVVQDISPE